MALPRNTAHEYEQHRAMCFCEYEIVRSLRVNDWFSRSAGLLLQPAGNDLPTALAITASLIQNITYCIRSLSDCKRSRSDQGEGGEHGGPAFPAVKSACCQRNVLAHPGDLPGRGFKPGRNARPFPRQFRPGILRQADENTQRRKCNDQVAPAVTD